MGTYAQNTSVGSDRSRNEIEKTLSRYGATGFMYGWNKGNAIIAFEANERRVKFILHLPDKTSPEFTRTPTGRKTRSPSQVEQAYEQSVRQKWRALALVIKAKLEAVESEITTFEEEFMAHLLLPGGQTVGDWMGPQIEHAYETGQMPPLLPEIAGA